MDDIAGMFAGGFSIFFARGRGLFHLPIGKSTLVGVPVVLDANNDGRLDIAVSCLNKLRILINNGRNSFNMHSYPAPADVNVGAGPMAAADFDRDGDVDLIGGNASSRTPIYLNDGKGGFAATTWLSARNEGILAADLNRDRKTDLVIDHSVFLGNGDATFKSGVQLSGPLDTALGLGDLNRDGKLDLVLSSSEVDHPAVFILTGNGKGAFAGYRSLQPKAGTKAGAVADFNGDGYSDLIAFDQPFGGMVQDPVLYVGGGDIVSGDGFFESGGHSEKIYQPDKISVLLS